MEYAYELKNKLCEELDKIARKPDLSAGDLEAAHKLSDTIKNLDKIEMLEDGGYSRAGGWEMGGRGSYDRGSSYRNQRRDSRGRYSRDGYSHHDSDDDVTDRLREMMENADEREKRILRRALSELEK